MPSMAGRSPWCALWWKSLETNQTAHRRGSCLNRQGTPRKWNPRQSLKDEVEPSVLNGPICKLHSKSEGPKGVPHAILRMNSKGCAPDTRRNSPRRSVHSLGFGVDKCALFSFTLLEPTLVGYLSSTTPTSHLTGPTHHMAGSSLKTRSVLLVLRVFNSQPLARVIYSLKPALHPPHLSTRTVEWHCPTW